MEIQIAVNQPDGEWLIFVECQKYQIRVVVYENNGNHHSVTPCNILAVRQCGDLSLICSRYTICTDQTIMSAIVLSIGIIQILAAAVNAGTFYIKS